MPRPDDLPSSAKFRAMPCGTRGKYIGARCRCMLCRAANSRYSTARAAKVRAGEWDGLVSASPARDHLVALSRAGVGTKSVAAACDVARSSLEDIRTGRKTLLRASTLARILAVSSDAKAGGALVSARGTWRRINTLLREGFTKKEIARRLKHNAPALQIRKRVCRLSTAVNVERLYETVMRGA